MNIEEFRELIKNYIIENYEEYEVTECDCTKNNNHVLHGLCIKNTGAIVAPTIYMENYFRDYNIVTSVVTIAGHIIESAKNAELKGDFDVNTFMSYEKMKGSVFLKLINTDKNSLMLKDVPHREFLDLSMVVYCDVSGICGVNASVTVRNEYLDKWGIEADELFDTAWTNTKKSGAVIKDMASLFGNITKELDIGVTLNDQMFVMTNQNKIFGAVFMTYDDVLDDFIKDSNCGVFIIPSSIHEVILIKDTDYVTGSSLSDMVKQVNRDCLETEDVLSDHAYYYSMEKGYNMI